MMKKHMILLALATVFLTAVLTGCGGGATVKLMPEDANLVNAPDVVVEPDKAPYNLGGWQDRNEVRWTVDIPKAGMYQILIEYSRPGNEPKVGGLITVETEEKEDELQFTAAPTGKNNRDWSVYKINDSCGIHLKKGKAALSIRPDFPDSYFGTQYFINLRSVTLKLND